MKESEELRGIGARSLEAEARRMLVADIERRHGASVAPMRAGGGHRRRRGARRDEWRDEGG